MNCKSAIEDTYFNILIPFLLDEQGINLIGYLQSTAPYDAYSGHVGAKVSPQFLLF
jgi:hypothetical protein